MLRFSLFYNFDILPGKSVPEMYREVEAQALAADALGFDAIWLAEHHFELYGRMPDPLLFLSRISGITQQIGLGTAIVEAPHYNPLRLAEDAALLDVLSHGRVRLGVGSGVVLQKTSRSGNVREKSKRGLIMTEQNPFKWRHFQADIILSCVRWYLRYALSYRDLEEMMAERGLSVDHTTIFRWVQQYVPELEKRCRPHLKACNDSWKVDETYIKIKTVWMYLYRAIDSQGNTLEFLLSPTRDAEAAKRFFLKSLHSIADSTPQAHPTKEQVAQPTALTDITAFTSAPRVITVDKNAAYPKAIAELKTAGVLPQHVELRQVKYLNNLIEQDHRFIKRLTKPGMGFFSFETAWRTLQGFEMMNMIRKGQLQGVNKGDIRGQIALVNTLFGMLA